jgi:signal transduction histidine kinase
VKPRAAARLAWTLWGLFPLLVGGALWLNVLGQGWGELARELPFVVAFFSFATVGALIASRQSGNLVGWLFLAVGVAAAVGASSSEYAGYGLDVLRDPFPGTVWLVWISSWSWILSIGTLIMFIPLLFPDGRLPSRRWRPFAFVAALFFMLTVLSFALDPDAPDLRGLPNPVGVPLFRGAADLFETAGLAVVLTIALGSAASLFIRYRRADREYRQQIKWFLFGVAVLVLWFVVSGVGEIFGYVIPTGPGDLLAAVAFMTVPIGAGIGILRYRLFDIDVVINRAVLFGALAAFITAIYVGVVVGIGALVGSRGNLLLSIVATALIAVLFQPIRERARHLANRLVYGKRATPYELLSEFAGRLGGAYSIDDVLPRMARVVGEGTGAAQARVWLRVGDELRPAAGWPADSGGPKSVPLAGNELPDLPGAERPFPVVHQGDLLGALSVATRAGESLTTSQEKLLSDLAAQAGLILRNVRLIEELRASRQRIVSAQDEERRRIERNIHDGAQQQLVALAVKLRLIETLARKDPAKAEAILDELQGETQEALENLRDLARGIYPPLLADKGLVAALEAQARKSPLRVELQANGVGRYHRDAEAAAYFCVLEALQNAAKYSGVPSARVRVWADDGALGFAVEDGGVGFQPERTPRGTGLQNMADRLEALGGRLEIRSGPGRGTVVSGRIPVRAEGPGG